MVNFMCCLMSQLHRKVTWLQRSLSELQQMKLENNFDQLKAETL